jgi:adenylate cyclase
MAVDRDTVVGLLWSDRSLQQGRSSLRQCLHDAKASLGLAADILTADRNRISLATARCAVDSGAGESSADFLREIEGCDPKFDAWIHGTRGKVSATPAVVVTLAANLVADARGAAGAWVWALRSALARDRWLSVVASEIDTHAKYAVRVAVRCDARGSAVWLELVERASGRILWTEARSMKHGLDLDHDQLALLAHVMASRIRLEECRQVALVDDRMLSGDGLIHRAVARLRSMTPEAFQAAERLLSRALEGDGESGRTNAYYAFAQVLRFGQGETSDLLTAREIARHHARKATEHSPDDAWAWAARGHVEAFLCRNAKVAIPWFDRALALDPSSSMAWSMSAAARCYVGDAATGVRHAKRAHDLDTAARGQFSFFATNILPIACSAAGDYEGAVRAAYEVLAENPNFIAAYPPLLTSLGHLGRVEEAEQYIGALREHMPDVSLVSLAEIFPLVRQGRAYLQGLERAGIPRG